MKVKNTTIKIVKGDITKLKVDAIVISTNSGVALDQGAGAVLRKKIGHDFEKAVWKKAPISIGDAVAMKYKKLKSKYLILAVPGEIPQMIETMLRRAAEKVFVLAQELKLKSIAITPLGCDVKGFSNVSAAKIIAQEAMKYLRQKNPTLKEIIFCLPDAASYKIFKKHIESYVEYMLHKQSQGPYLTVDILIELEEGLIVIERSNPPLGFALPGGFVDYGESVETAARREAKEETNVDLVDLKQFSTYSEPTRDPRFHTVAVVFIAKGQGRPQFGDDAKGLKVVRYEDLLKLDYAFDHKRIIEDYLNKRLNRDTLNFSSKNDQI